MIFDQFSRYRAVALACDALLKQANLPADATISDIGSGPYKLLGEFITAARITYIDPLLTTISKTKESETVLALDIFKDFGEISSSKTDLVVAVDTLEHIPPDQRLDFLEKIYSVKKTGIVIAFPCSDTPESNDVDVFGNNFFKNTFGEDYSWLAEHFEYGLPSSQETSDFFKAKGMEVASFRQGNSDWLKELLPTVLALNEFEFLAEVIEEQSNFFNEDLAPFDIGITGYRSIIVASHLKIDLEAILPSNRPPEGELNSKVAQIKAALINQSIFPALAKLRNLRAEVINVQRKSVEIGNWGLSLQQKILELENKFSQTE